MYQCVSRWLSEVYGLSVTPRGAAPADIHGRVFHHSTKKLWKHASSHEFICSMQHGKRNAHVLVPNMSGTTTVKTTSNGSRIMKRCTSVRSHAKKRSRELPTVSREKRQP